MAKSVVLYFLLIISASSLASQLETVKEVDLNRYLGLWYQIAYFPTWFQKEDCPVTTAQYSLRPDGNIKVYNACWRDSVGGELINDATAKAWPADESIARLKVQFFWPFRGNYWIIMLDELDYQWAVVSEPQMKYLWILCRQPQMDIDLYDAIVTELDNRGFDLTRLVKTSR